MANWLIQLSPTLKLFLDLLEIILVLTALLITAADSVNQIISTYRLQSGLLAFVTGLTALIKSIERAAQGSSSGTDVIILILLIALLPIFLLLAIKPLLARATLTTPFSTSIAHLIISRQEMEHNAEREWLRYRPLPGVQSALLASLLWVFMAFLVAFQIQSKEFTTSDRIGLAVSLTLHLVGLYNMVIKRDIISQVIGLLIMDHGLYLAVVKIVEIPVPATFFVISLYFYTLITVFILVILLPRVRREAKSLDLSAISGESKLKG